MCTYIYIHIYMYTYYIYIYVPDWPAAGSELATAGI
jgi:hypothetical protein